MLHLQERIQKVPTIPPAQQHTLIHHLQVLIPIQRQEQDLTQLHHMARHLEAILPRRHMEHPRMEPLLTVHLPTEHQAMVPLSTTLQAMVPHPMEPLNIARQATAPQVMVLPPNT